MNKILASILCATTLLFAGCKTTPAVTQAVVKNAVQLGVTFGTQQSPEAIPYLRFAAPVVCEAASGTNTQPAWIIDALNANAQANSVKNQQASMIFNAAFGIYESLYIGFGADGVQNQKQLQAWLQGVCEGILGGLPPTTVALRATVVLPPHLKP